MLIKIHVINGVKIIVNLKKHLMIIGVFFNEFIWNLIIKSNFKLSK